MCISKGGRKKVDEYVGKEREAGRLLGLIVQRSTLVLLE